jgi:hypothetical protein
MAVRKEVGMRKVTVFLVLFLGAIVWGIVTKKFTSAGELAFAVLFLGGILALVFGVEWAARKFTSVFVCWVPWLGWKLGRLWGKSIRMLKLLVCSIGGLLRGKNTWQRTVLWVTTSLVLLEIACPKTVVLFWVVGHWQRIPGHTIAELVGSRNSRYPWARQVGSRKLITELEQWQEEDENFKEWPDFNRMGVEVLLTVLIGGGLLYVCPQGDRRANSSVSHG